MSHVDLLQSETKQKLLVLMKRHGEISLDDATDAIDRARPTLRNHLDRMGRDGLVHRRSEKHGRGRPRMQYRLTPLADRLFPQQEGKVFAEFLDYLRERGCDELIEDFFDSFWSARLREVEQRITGSLEAASPQRILDVLKSVLAENGFMPEIETEGDQVTIRECNCPFAEIVGASDVPCASEACFYETLFDHVERTAHIPDGNSACVYELRVLE